MERVPSRFERRLSALSGLALLVGVLAVGTDAQTAFAQQASLSGRWSGTGTVTLASGNKENVRCTATFSARGGKTFAMTANCATQDVRVQQFATVDQTSAGRFEGDFNNPQLGVSGFIRITLSGNTLTASLSATGGSATMTMRR